MFDYIEYILYGYDYYGYILYSDIFYTEILKLIIDYIIMYMCITK